MIGYTVQWRVKKTGKRGSAYRYLPKSDRVWTELLPGRKKRKLLPPFTTSARARMALDVWKAKEHGDLFDFRLWMREWV